MITIFKWIGFYNNYGGSMITIGEVFKPFAYVCNPNSEELTEIQQKIALSAAVILSFCTLGSFPILCCGFRAVCGDNPQDHLVLNETKKILIQPKIQINQLAPQFKKTDENVIIQVDLSIQYKMLLDAIKLNDLGKIIQLHNSACGDSILLKDFKEFWNEPKKPLNPIKFAIESGYELEAILLTKLLFQDKIKFPNQNLIYPESWGGSGWNEQEIPFIIAWESKKTTLIAAYSLMGLMDESNSFEALSYMWEDENEEAKKWVLKIDQMLKNNF